MAYLNSTVKIRFVVGNVRNSMLHDYATFYVIFVYFCIVFDLFCLFTYFHFFFFHFFSPVFTCKYILTLKKAKAESSLSLIYSCTVNGLIPLYIRCHRTIIMMITLVAPHVCHIDVTRVK